MDFIKRSSIKMKLKEVKDAKGIFNFPLFNSFVERIEFLNFKIFKINAQGYCGRGIDSIWENKFA